LAPSTTDHSPRTLQPESEIVVMRISISRSGRERSERLGVRKQTRKSDFPHARQAQGDLPTGGDPTINSAWPETLVRVAPRMWGSIWLTLPI
jgi:hypothetical protein